MLLLDPPPLVPAHLSPLSTLSEVPSSVLNTRAILSRVLSPQQATPFSTSLAEHIFFPPFSACFPPFRLFLRLLLSSAPSRLFSPAFSDLSLPSSLSHAEQVTPLPGPTARPLTFPSLHESHCCCSYLTSCLSSLPGLVGAPLGQGR